MVTAELSDYSIEAILSWLPVKSLMRFKCVGKSWCALTCNPYLVEQHHTHSALRPNATHLLLSYGRNSYLEYEPTILTAAPNGGATSCHALPNILEHGPFNMSCCHGLISMHPLDKSKANTYVYNPSTRETLSIPFNANAFKAYTFVRSFIGFEPLSNQYKLMILSYQRNEYAYSSTNCEIITLGTKNWRQIAINKTSPHRFGNYYSTYLDGALYWLAYNRQSIVVFDLKSDKFGAILVPKPIQQRLWLTKTIIELCQVRQRLTLVVSRSCRADESFELWTTTDYNNGVWVKESFVFSLPWDLASTVPTRHKYLRVVGGVNNDEILITLKPEAYFKLEAFFVYNMKTKKGRKINIIRGDKDKTNVLGQVMLYTESMRCY